MLHKIASREFPSYFLSARQHDLAAPTLMLPKTRVLRMRAVLDHRSALLAFSGSGTLHCHSGYRLKKRRWPTATNPGGAGPGADVVGGREGFHVTWPVKKKMGCHGIRLNVTNAGGGAGMYGKP